MRMPADSLPGSSVRDNLVTAAEAVRLVRDGDSVAVDGFMGQRIFAAEPMGLKDDLLTMPLEARFAYDAERNMFFLNMEGMSLVSRDQLKVIGTAVHKRLSSISQHRADRPGCRRPPPSLPVISATGSTTRHVSSGHRACGRRTVTATP